LSAALIIGGKDLVTEQEHIRTMNIVIATPGRLLQHMDETSSFDYDRLQILVMDEVDRILDMGFKNDVD
jgi:ATP-dependent RNA helicase DDX10/DBP4